MGCRQRPCPGAVDVLLEERESESGAGPRQRQTTIRPARGFETAPGRAGFATRPDALVEKTPLNGPTGWLRGVQCRPAGGGVALKFYQISKPLDAWGEGAWRRVRSGVQRRRAAESISRSVT